MKRLFLFLFLIVGCSGTRQFAEVERQTAVIEGNGPIVVVAEQPKLKDPDAGVDDTDTMLVDTDEIVVVFDGDAGVYAWEEDTAKNRVVVEPDDVVLNGVEPEFSKDVKVLDAVALVGRNDDMSSIIALPTDDVTALEPGQVIASEKGEGMLRRVKSVRNRDDGSVEIETEKVSLSGVFDRINMEYTPKKSLFSRVRIPKGKYSFPLTNGLGVTLDIDTAKADLSISSHLHLENKGGSFYRGEVWISSCGNIEFHGDVTITKNILDQGGSDIVLAELQDVYYVWWIGILPIVFHVELDLVFLPQMSIELGQNFRIDFEYVMKRQLYTFCNRDRCEIEAKPFECRPNMVDAVEGHEGGFDFELGESYLSASAKAGVYLKGSVKVMGLLGPELYIGPAVEVGGKISTKKSSYGFCGGLEAKANLKFEFFDLGFKLLDCPHIPIACWQFEPANENCEDCPSMRNWGAIPLGELCN